MEENNKNELMDVNQEDSDIQYYDFDEAGEPNQMMTGMAIGAGIAGLLAGGIWLVGKVRKKIKDKKAAKTKKEAAEEIEEDDEDPVIVVEDDEPEKEQPKKEDK